MLVWWQVLAGETCCKLRLEGLRHLGHACHAEAATKLCVLDGDNKNLSKALTLTSPNGCNMSCTHTYTSSMKCICVLNKSRLQHTPMAQMAHRQPHYTRIDICFSRVISHFRSHINTAFSKMWAPSCELFPPPPTKIHSSSLKHHPNNLKHQHLYT
jgi:hypothetical protein